MHLKPCHAHINDINRPLMHTYKAIEEQSSDILALLSEMDYKLRQEGETHYYRIRDAYNQRVAEGCYDAYLSAAFIFLNKHGFNGLFRVNRHGEFNVPYNQSVCPSYARKNME